MAKRAQRHRLEGGGAIYKRGRVWWVEWTSLMTGRRYRRTTRATQVEAARRNARQVMRVQELREAGVEVDDKADLLALVQGWGDYLLEKRGRTKRHVDESVATVRAYVNECDLTHPAMLTAESAERWLEKRRKARGWANRTYNANAGYLTAFGRWLAVRAKVVSRSPFLGIERRDKAPVRERRALTDAEVTKLLETAPWPWALIYRTMLCTGLRRRELNDLEWRDVGLKTGVLQVRWDNAKNREPDFLPIEPTLAAGLRKLLEARRHGITEDPDVVARIRAWSGSVNELRKRLLDEGVRRASGAQWHARHLKAVREESPVRLVPPTEKVFGDCLRRDVKPGANLYKHLDAAGINRAGVDYHSLRKTFGTRLRRRGLDVWTITRLMRHQDPKVTQEHYQQFDASELGGAVEGIA